MNRFAARGLVEEALRGAEIVVISVGAHDNAETMKLLCSELGDRPHRAGLAAGRGTLDIADGGRVRVLSWRSQKLRALRAQIVYLDAGVEQELRSFERLREIREIVDAHPAGEIVRA